jgi:hypothetical protein
MSLWTKLFGTRSDTPVVRSHLGLVRLDDRTLPSVTLPDGTVWVAPMLPPEQTAMPTEVPYANPTAGNAAAKAQVHEDKLIDNPDAPKDITGTIGIDAKSISSAEKGKFTPKGDKEKESTDKELSGRAAYYKQYDGPTEFKAEYTIGLKEDGSFDASKSSVTFTTVNYTSRTLVSQQKSTTVSAEDEADLIKQGKFVYRHGDTAYIYDKPRLVKSGWKTVSIPITEASLKDGKLQSFKFKSDTWYTKPGELIIDKGIVGEVDLVAGKASFTAKYQSASTGVIATYLVEGTIKK